MGKVLAGSAAYAFGEAHGWKCGLANKPWEAVGFYSVIAAATARHWQAGSAHPPAAAHGVDFEKIGSRRRRHSVRIPHQLKSRSASLRTGTAATSRTEGDEIRSESLLGDFSISEIWIGSHPEIRFVFNGLENLAAMKCGQGPSRGMGAGGEELTARGRTGGRPYG
jgi:hypothetical protein